MFLWSGRLASWLAGCGTQKSPCLWNFQNTVTWLCWIDNGVPIDIWRDYYYQVDFSVTLFGSHNFLCQSLQLNTTVLNDITYIHTYVHT